LGFSVQLPDALKESVDAAAMSANLQLSFPLADGLLMVISLGKGNFNGEEVLMMDTMVRSTTEVAAEIDAVMGVLGKARETIHKTFFGLTGKMHGMMGLRES
jgi:hypothetical protein